MRAFREKTWDEVKEELKEVKSVGIISCGFCPALQKKGGTVGIERWKRYSEIEFEVKWSVVGPAMCDERMYIIHMDEMSDKLDEVDKILVMACEAGTCMISTFSGYDCVACLESLYAGILRSNGVVERIERTGGDEK